MSMHNLRYDPPVRKANDKSILGRAVLVLRLRDQMLARIVIGLAFPTSTVLHLRAREVRVRFLFPDGRRLEGLDIG